MNQACALNLGFPDVQAPVPTSCDILVSKNIVSGMLENSKYCIHRQEDHKPARLGACYTAHKTALYGVHYEGT